MSKCSPFTVEARGKQISVRQSEGKHQREEAYGKSEEDTIGENKSGNMTRNIKHCRSNHLLTVKMIHDNYKLSYTIKMI